MALSSTSQKEDSVWCRVVAIACFWINFCFIGVFRSYAVIYIALIEHYELTRKEAAWPSGVYGFFMGIAGLLSGYLTSHLSIRCILFVAAIMSSVAVSLCSLATDLWHIIILFGAFQGIGLGLTLALTQLIMNRCFVRYVSRAIGLSMSGASVGALVFPLLMHWLLEEFGLQGTFLLVGGIMLNSLIGVALLKEPDTESPPVSKTSCNDSEDDSEFKLENNAGGSPAKKEENRCDIECRWKASLLNTVQLMTNVDFCMILTVYAIFLFMFGIYNLIIMDFAKDRSIPTELSVYLVPVFSLGDLTGRIGGGWITDRKWVRRKTMVRISLSLHGILMVLLSFSYDYVSMMITYSMLGIMYGTVSISQSPLLAESFGRRLLPYAIGICVSTLGISAILRPPLIGYFRDHNQSYGLIFIWFGSAQIILVVIWLIGTRIRKLNTHRRLGL